jgi:hypothetical protein
LLSTGCFGYTLHTGHSFDSFVVITILASCPRFFYLFLSFEKGSIFFGFAVLLIMAIFTLAGCGDSGSGDPSSPTSPAKAATPTASPAAGTVIPGTPIILSTSTSGATIRYTTDGTNPASTSGTVYSASNKPTITAATTIKAIAYKDDIIDSDVLTAAYAIATFTNPPDTMADVAAAKAYFEIIWDDIPAAWQTFFMTLWAEEGADGGGVVPTSLDQLDEDTWKEMVGYWPQYRQVWPALASQMNEGKSPIAAPPVWPADGTVIKNYVEGIWNDLTEGWQGYYLNTITTYYNYNHPDDLISPANLAAVPDRVWTYMKTAWNGHRWEPEDAQSIFEHLAMAVSFGMSPDDENLEDFIYAG